MTIILCTLHVYAAEPVISRVALSEKTIDLTKNEKAVIQFQLSEKAIVDLEIYDESNALIQEIVGEEMLKKGKHKLEWDGRNDSGEQVASGVYVYVLEARGKKPFRFDSRDQTGGEEVLVEKLSWDVPNGKIQYLLPKASYARIRIGLKEGVFLGALQDWVPLAAGQKEFPWDGLDPSRQFDLTNHEEAQINIAAFALPDNAVIVKAPVVLTHPAVILRPSPVMLSEAKHPKTNSAGDPSAALQPQDDTGQGLRLGARSQYIHSRHPRALCHEPRFTVEFPSVANNPSSSPLPLRERDRVRGENSDIPVLSGKSPVRITLELEDKDYLVGNRFEVMFFVDTQFLFEQEEGTSPLTIDLDSSRLGQGDHLLTVNIMDYEDHIGVQTIKVRVEGEKSLNA